MRLMTALAFGLAVAGPAAAQTAPSDAGAKALGEALAVYFGSTAFEKKVVTVAPEASGYRIVFAPNAAIAPLLEPGMKVDVKPYSVLAVERADGNWDVSSTDPVALSFDVTVEGQRQTGDYRFQDGTFSGVYSPKLGVFLSGTATIPGGTVTASDNASDVKATFGPMVHETSAQEAAAGAVDAKSRQTIAKLDETVEIRSNAEYGTEGSKVEIATGEIASATTMAGFKTRAILDLWAFAVARAGTDAVMRDQETLRGLLGAAMPLWGRLEGNTDVRDVAITSAFGTLSVETAKVGIAMDGIGAASGFSYGFDLAGLSTTSALVPAWASGLVPKDVSLKLKLADVDLETPAKRFIAEFDLSQDPVVPEETSAALAADFAIHPPRLVIEPSRLTSRDLDVTIEGQFTFANVQPEADVTIEAKGLETVISTLQAQAAKDPSVNETVGMLALSQGFAKRLPDGRSQWIVSTKADGSVILNGNQIVAPTPEAEEEIELPATPAPTDENALPTEDPAAKP